MENKYFTPSTEDIEWRPVKDYEGLYEVSNKGEIKSLTKSWRSGHRNALRTAPEKILSPYKAGRGYLCVRLCKDTAQKSNYIHILVAKHFNENPNNLPEVNHIDGNKLNNNKTNLEWTTSSGNRKHAYDTGLKRFKGNRYVLRP